MFCLQESMNGQPSRGVSSDDLNHGAAQNCDVCRPDLESYKSCRLRGNTESWEPLGFHIRSLIPPPSVHSSPSIMSHYKPGRASAGWHSLHQSWLLRNINYIYFALFRILCLGGPALSHYCPGSNSGGRLMSIYLHKLHIIIGLVGPLCGWSSSHTLLSFGLFRRPKSGLHNCSSRIGSCPCTRLVAAWMPGRRRRMLLADLGGWGGLPHGAVQGGQ